MWDRVVAGATMVVIFAAVSILLSAKKQLLSISTVPAVRQHLETVNNTKIWTYNVNFTRFLLPQIPREKTALVVNHALEMWESLGSPMEPGMGIE